MVITQIKWHLISGITKNRGTQFVLCVVDFGVKYYKNEDIQHLQNELQQVYDVTIDYMGENYYGLILKWNYQAKHGDVSMLKFGPKAISKLQHTALNKPQHSPHEHVIPVFEQQQQFTPAVDK